MNHSVVTFVDIAPNATERARVTLPEGALLLRVQLSAVFADDADDACRSIRCLEIGGEFDPVSAHPLPRDAVLWLDVKNEATRAVRASVGFIWIDGAQ
jgi:hypothetical protein